MKVFCSKKIISVAIFTVVFSVTVAFSERCLSAGAMDELMIRLNSKDRQVQMLAVEDLGKINNEKAVEILLNLVMNRAEDWRVKIRALQILGNVQDPIVSDKLVTMFNNPFLNEDCPAIKWNTAIALGKSFNKGTRAVASLIEALDEEDILLREVAIQSLGKIGDKTSVPYLLPALYDRSFAIRRSAIEALGSIGDPQAAPLLKRVAETDKDMFIRNEVMAALKKLNTD